MYAAGKNGKKLAVKHKTWKVICITKSPGTTNTKPKTSKYAAYHTKNLKVFDTIPSRMFI